eukprot:NODE_4617_length_1039_cov_77.336245_g4414_i0.p1 GENE.NODE_4617_length_1039_cov_77.336245_g4414_i0~~NODE_4617_length_1039_cov_77.336245_g4414_i0.p1  ORF type:complete len:287 (-),score=74.23 NODE_4617_length_1039_cov_77.336245_g4414_i0:179-955(-)
MKRSIVLSLRYRSTVDKEWPGLKPEWIPLRNEMQRMNDPVWRKLALSRIIVRKQIGQVRQAYLKEYQDKKRAERDAEIVAMHGVIARNQQHYKDRFEATLQLQRDQVHKREASEIIRKRRYEQRQERYYAEEWARLCADAVLLKELDQLSKSFVTLENVEAKIEEELDRYVGLDAVRRNNIGLRPYLETAECTVMVDTPGTTGSKMPDDVDDGFAETFPDLSSPSNDGGPSSNQAGPQGGASNKPKGSTEATWDSSKT